MLLITEKAHLLKVGLFCYQVGYKQNDSRFRRSRFA